PTAFAVATVTFTYTMQQFSRLFSRASAGVTRRAVFGATRRAYSTPASKPSGGASAYLEPTGIIFCLVGLGAALYFKKTATEYDSIFSDDKWPVKDAVKAAPAAPAEPGAGAAATKKVAALMSFIDEFEVYIANKAEEVEEAVEEVVAEVVEEVEAATVVAEEAVEEAVTAVEPVFSAIVAEVEAVAEEVVEKVEAAVEAVKEEIADELSPSETKEEPVVVEPVEPVVETKEE
ncbi:uncharacterized protein V1518DRAFT_412415, partial [Limtongia smithiae]|uniref:uncharacterized protein n=1 Tax=Limtongia smithiae TaxID=1125753 RepID=UPI0034CD9E46